MKDKFVFATYKKSNSSAGLEQFKQAMRGKVKMKEEKIPKELIQRVEMEEKLKLSPHVYEIKGLYSKYGNSALEHDRSIFVDADLPPEMRKLAIYHELKEVAGKDRGLSSNDAHMNARDGEIKYADELGLKLEETPEEYRLNFASHLSQMPWASQMGYNRVLLSKKQQDKISGRLQEIGIEKQALVEKHDELIERLNLNIKPYQTRRMLKLIRKKIDKLYEEEYQLRDKFNKHAQEIRKEQQKIGETEPKYPALY